MTRSYTYKDIAYRHIYTCDQCHTQRLWGVATSPTLETVTAVLDCSGCAKLTRHVYEKTETADKTATHKKGQHLKYSGSEW